jgi:hypothetical protein
MSTRGFPGSPALMRAGLVSIDASTASVLNVVTFQYNPDTVTRTLKPRGVGGEPGDRLEVLRLTGPPHESIKLEGELDAADQLEDVLDPGYNSPVPAFGLLPALGAIEALITPPSAQLLATDALFDQGTLEIIPLEAPLTLLVWGVNRVVPVLLGDVSITEEAFDPHLHPIRAKVSLEFRVLTTSDLPVQHLGGALYLKYRQNVEQLAAMVNTNAVGPLGLEHVP